MNEVSWEKIKKKFENIGLNIFLTTSITQLPEKLKEQLISDQYNLNEYSSLVLIGNGGRTFWEKLDINNFNESDPIDNFCINKLNECFEEKIQILYPSEEFIPPLQQIGRYFNFAHPSPLGLDISNEFGPWFAYRLLFLTKNKIQEYQYGEKKSPCETCLNKECIDHCPASATQVLGIDLKKCLDYRFIYHSNCRDRCLARMSCPYKNEHQYSIEQINYHMLKLYKLV